MAKLYFRYGAMGSGKTRDLIKTMYNYEYRNMRAIIIKPVVDTKAGCCITSRDGTIMDIDYVFNGEENLYELIVNDGRIINCVLVEEAQFLEPHQVDELSDVVDYLEIPVICYGLRADFQTYLFPGSKRLLELADSIEEVKTICRCGRKATMNTRMVEGSFVFEGHQVAIDGEGNVTYDSLCRGCYKKEKAKVKKLEK